MRPVRSSSPPVLSRSTTQAVQAPRAEPASEHAPRAEPSLVPSSSDVTAKLGGGLPPALLSRHLDAAARTFQAMLDGPLPSDLSALVDTYSQLGSALAKAEASLLSALDALDPATGGGRAEPADAFVALRERAFDTLRLAGRVFDHLEPAFSRHVHGSSGWPPQPVEVAPDRGDGKPLVNYRNTYKKGRPLDLEERKQQHEKRVDKFLAEGGRFDALEIADAADVARMPHGVRHDYVMTAERNMRMVPRTDESGQPLMDPGHSLLATGGPAFDDKAVLLAGELWCLRDSAGDLEAVFVANNSGHFKPRYEDLPNAEGVLASLGVPPEKVVLFGGPNNLPSMFEEILEKHGMDGVMEKLPPSARSVLDEWHKAGAFSPLSVRF